MFSIKTTIVASILSATSITASVCSAEIEVLSGSYVLDPAHASLTWKVNHFGLSNYTARFTKFDVALNLDVENIEKSKVVVAIDPSSVKTDFIGEMDFDGEVSNDSKFLDSKNFPSIEFTSNNIELMNENSALIHGNMTMLGVTRPITLSAKLNGVMAAHPYAKVPAIGFHAEGSIKRSDFGFDYLVPYVGDKVSFVVEAEFIKAKQ